MSGHAWFLTGVAVGCWIGYFAVRWDDIVAHLRGLRFHRRMERLRRLPRGHHIEATIGRIADEGTTETVREVGGE